MSPGERMTSLMAELFPLCRSITGQGVRDTLSTVAGRIPLEVHEVPSGTQVLDWTVPDEWNIRDAYVARPDGERVVDFLASNLHVVGYSEPIRAEMSLEELRPHLHAHAERPDWVPYRTSYYSRTWGFCLTRNDLDALTEGPYEVVVDSTLERGSLTYGECVIPGDSDAEVLLTTHVCHPSLANDNLSGIALLTQLAETLAASPRHFTYRFLFIPGTIGSITWLARNGTRLEAIVAGLVVACVGDGAPLSYKRTHLGDASIDRAAAHVVSRSSGGNVLDYVPWGWDERQFNSPGFRLPVGSLCRSREGEYAEYHSSADDHELVSSERLDEALRAVIDILDVLETDRRYVNLAPRGEPQLGRRGLYPSVGGAAAEEEQLAMLWVLHLSDGRHSLLEVAGRSGLPFGAIRDAARRLRGAGLLDESAS